MMEFWIVPSLIVAFLLYLMMRADGVKMRDLSTEVWGLFIFYSVVWPIGLGCCVYAAWSKRREI